jgi:hypothetical protein
MPTINPATEDWPMADPPPFPNADDADEEPARAPGAPAWLSVLGIVIGALVVVLVVALHLLGVVGPGAH